MLHSEQAQELIRGMLEKQWESSWLPLELPLGDGIWVVLCAFAWGALVEVCARALIFSPYPRKPRVSVGVNAPYELVIRVVGFAGWASVMIPALNATQIPDIRSDVHVSLGPLLAFAMLSFFLLLLFFETALFAALCRVARWFPMLLRNPNFRAAMFPIPIRDPTFRAASRPDRAAVTFAIACGFGMVGLAWFPVRPSLQLGSLATFLLCISIWLVFTTALSLWWRHNRPGKVITLGRLTVFLIICVFGVEFGVEFIAALFQRSAEEFTRSRGGLPVRERIVDDGRLVPHEYVDQWLQERVDSGEIESRTAAKYAVFLVAAEGGGLRAAYWTAQVRHICRTIFRGSAIIS
jgi:hypothetical protein